MTARRAVVAVSVSLALTSGCGGSQEISAEDTVRAEQLLSQTDGSLEGERSRFGDLLTAWAIQEDEDGEYDASTGSYRLASCVAVNLEHRIDNEEDLFLATGTVADEHCIGPKPQVSKPALPTGSPEDREAALRIFAAEGYPRLSSWPAEYVTGTHPTAHDPKLWFAQLEPFSGCWGANLSTGDMEPLANEDCLRASYR